MYITYLNPPKTRQITFDEILAGVQNVEALHYGGSNTSTMTVCRNDLTAKLRAITNVPEMIEKLAAYNVSHGAVIDAIRNANQEAGGSVLELGEAEYVVRASGLLATLDDFRKIPLSATDAGVSVRLGDVARVQVGPEMRRGRRQRDRALFAAEFLDAPRGLPPAQAVGALQHPLREPDHLGHRASIPQQLAVLTHGADGLFS